MEISIITDAERCGGKKAAQFEIAAIQSNRDRQRMGEPGILLLRRYLYDDG
jgi:hypothetical protein